MNAKRLFPDPVGNKVRAGDQIQGAGAEQKADKGGFPVFAVIFRRLRQLAAVNIRRVFAKPGNDRGVKTFYAGFARVGAQGCKRFFAKFPVSRSGFQLHDDRRFAGNGCKHLVKQRDLLFGSAEAQFLQFGKVQFVHPLGNAANTFQGVVMENNDLPVAGELNVKLHPVAVLHRAGKRGKRIFGNALVLLVQPAMGNVFAVKRGFFLFTGTCRRKNKNRKQKQKRSKNDENDNPGLHGSISVNGFQTVNISHFFRLDILYESNKYGAAERKQDR